MINPNTYGSLSMAKKKYYPNNWKNIKDAPEQFFIPLEYDEFMDWKINGWEIPSSVACIIREQDMKTGKVKEYVYNTIRGANKRARKIMEEAKSEFIVCTHDDIGHMFPKHMIGKDTVYEEGKTFGPDDDFFGLEPPDECDERGRPL